MSKELLNRLFDDTTPNISTYRSSKDANDIFIQIDKKRADSTLYSRSVLSGGTSPTYTTRTVSYYDTDGVTVMDTKVFSLSYDGTGKLISEVMN